MEPDLKPKQHHGPDDEVALIKKAKLPFLLGTQGAHSAHSRGQKAGALITCFLNPLPELRSLTKSDASSMSSPCHGSPSAHPSPMCQPTRARAGLPNPSEPRGCSC